MSPSEAPEITASLQNKKRKKADNNSTERIFRFIASPDACVVINLRVRLLFYVEYDKIYDIRDQIREGKGNDVSIK